MSEAPPKLMHTLAKIYLQPVTQKTFFGKSYIPSMALMGVQAHLFERCAIIGSLCRDAKFPFFVILGGAEGMEEGGLAALDGLTSDFVLPYISGVKSTNEVVQNSMMAQMNFHGSTMEFIGLLAKEKVPPESAFTITTLWASMGGYIGLEYPELIEDWLYSTYDSTDGVYSKWDEARSFGLDISSEKPYASSDDVIAEATTLFTEYCKQFYPEKIRHFSFMG